MRTTTTLVTISPKVARARLHLGVLQNLSGSAVMTEMIEIVETEGQIVGGQMCPKIIDRFLAGRRVQKVQLANP